MERRSMIGQTVAAALGAVGLGRVGKLVVPPGSLVTYDEAGIPWRGSLDPDSPYFSGLSFDLVITLDDRLAISRNIGIAVYEFDRRSGWVEGDLTNAAGDVILPEESRRLHGRVEARWSTQRTRIQVDGDAARVARHVRDALKRQAMTQSPDGGRWPGA